MYRGFNPRTESPGWWVLREDDGRLGWKRQQAFHTSDRLNIEVERQMGRLGAVTVYHEPERTLISFDAENGDTQLLRQLACYEGLGDPPYFVRYFLQGWCLRIVPDRPALLDLIESIAATENVFFLPQPLEIQELPISAAPDQDLLREVINHPALFSSEMVSYSQDGYGLRYHSIGPAAPVVAMLGERWRQQTIGAPFDRGFHDRSFDQRTAEIYREVLKTRTPRLSLIRGTLDTPDGPVYQNYYRLVVYIRGREPRVASLARLAGNAGPPATGGTVR